MLISFRLFSYLFTLIILLLLGWLVYYNNTKSRKNLVFALFTATISAWIISLAFADNSSSLPIVDAASRFAFVSGAWLITLVPYLALVFAERKLTWKSIIWALPALIFTLAAPTHLAIEGVSIEPYGAGVAPGLMYLIFSVYAPAYLITGTALLGRALRRATGKEKSQLRYLTYGLGLSTLAAILTNLLFVSLGYLGPASFLIFASLTAYAMIRHRLFDIRILVARSLAYILFFTTLAAIYTAVLVLASNYLFDGASSSPAQLVVTIVTGIVVALTIQPLRHFFEKITDGIFFHDRYDSQALLDAISSITTSELLLERLLDRCLQEIQQQMHLSGGQFIILDGDKLYQEEHTGTLKVDMTALASIQRLHQTILVADDMEAGAAKTTLTTSRIRVSLQLRTKEEVVGYLWLGDKLSGEIYSTRDLRLLEIVRKELAVAIVNAKAYKEIARFNETLQERVQRATERLRSANRTLKVLDKTKDDFISMASHQLGTPLSTITGYLSMAIDEDRDNMTIQQREYVNFAMEAAERMVGMSSDLLNVSRINSGRFMMQPQVVDLPKMVQQEVQQLRAAAERKGLRLTFTASATPLPEIKLDESKTRQVIMNFIDNAIYYSERGTITVELGIQGKTLVLTVTDTGMGVPVAEQEHLFTKFYRAENAKIVRPDGTGLGLYLAKRVIEEQQGTLIFTSEVGRGSTFGFSFPVK